MMVTFSKALNFPSSIENLGLVEEVIDSMVSERYISEEVYGNIIVAATEATLNAILHGNQHKDSNITSVRFQIENGLLEIVVEDQGNGFDFHGLPDPTSPENLEKVNGRGIFIIRNLADKVDFEKNGARLVMQFNIAAPLAASA